MFHVQHIASFDLPELAPYRTMRRPLGHRQEGIFVAEGAKVVRRLLESRLAVVSAVLTEQWLPEFEPLLAARPEPEIPVYLAEKKLLESLVGFPMFQGVLAIGRVPAPESLQTLLARSASPRLLVAVDALTNAENLGTLVRNCAAFGVQVLLVGETCSSPFVRRSVRSSMGAIFQLPVVELGTDRRAAGALPQDAASCATLAETLRRLRAGGLRCIAAHPHAPGRTLAQARLEGDCCLVFGSEGYGIRPEVLAACDEAVAIPMPPAVDSLNVSAAAAVFLYEACRQRGRM